MNEGTRHLPAAPAPTTQFAGGILLNSNGGNRLVNDINAIKSAMREAGTVGAIDRVRVGVPIWIMITGATLDGDNNRWKYSWTQIAKFGPGYSSWQEVDDGWTGTDTLNTGYNVAESNNGAPDTDAIRVPNNKHVLAVAIETVDGDTPVIEFWFHYAPPKRVHTNITITGSTQDGTNKRWTYTAVEVEKTAAGFGGWTAKVGGWGGNAYNRIEEMNGASGLYGNGVNSANLTGTLDIQPAPDNLVIDADLIVIDDETTEAQFSYENGIDGECE